MIRLAAQDALAGRIDVDRPAPTRSIVHVLAAASFGGLESVVAQLAEHQRAAGHRVEAVLLGLEGSDSPFAAKLRRRGVGVHIVAAGGRAYRRQRAEIVARCARVRADIIHSHGFRADVLVASAKRALGVPLVSTIHGYTGGDWKMRCYEWLQRRAHRRVDALIAVSRPIREQLRAAGIPSARLHLIANACSPQPSTLSREDARRKLLLPEGAFVVGWIGRLTREKGADVFIEALASSRAPRDATAVVIGDGSERESLVRRAGTLGLDRRVQWVGALPDAARVIAAFDAVVLSSRTEGTPMVLLEAMAARTPVIATRVGGVPDVVSSREALLVPAESPDALAAAITAVKVDRSNARLRADRAFTVLVERHGAGAWLRSHDIVYQHVQPRQSYGVVR